MHIFEVRCFLYLIALSMIFSCSDKKADEGEDLYSGIEKVLNDHILNVWYPRVIDTLNGGYYSDFSYDWKKEGPQQKFIVTQARHVWSLSFLYENYAQEEQYLRDAHHGFEFLKQKMWDSEFGGFFELTDSTGTLSPDPVSKTKRAYGNSFAIYALAQYYKVSQNKEALQLAKQAFSWLENGAHDKVHGGYFQVLNQDGTPVLLSDSAQFSAYDKNSIEIKDFNSSIHLLEAFTTLYQVWPDSLVKLRLQEMYDIVSGTMLDERGFLKLYFHPDWSPVSDDVIVNQENAIPSYRNYITFGHDVETAFLLYEAAEALELDKSDLLPKMKKMVDHALEHGWDKETGGLYDQGKYIDGKMNIINRHKEWWGQAEALNAFLLMHRLFDKEDDFYLKKFEEQWKYIYKYLLDHEHYGWFIGGTDEDPKAKNAPKAQIWKGNYHTTRALVTCLTELEALKAGNH